MGGSAAGWAGLPAAELPTVMLNARLLERNYSFFERCDNFCRNTASPAMPAPSMSSDPVSGTLTGVPAIVHSFAPLTEVIS